jgi:hypothetical protein
MDTEELLKQRNEVIRLRLAGRSRSEIKAITGIASNKFLTSALRDVPPPAWTRRPNAKDDLRARARELRAGGLAYNEIVRQLGVSKGSVSLWVRDMPRLQEHEIRRRQASGGAVFWEAERQRRSAARQETRDCAAREIGSLTEREVLICGAVAYWCEGAKSKPHRRSERVEFVNSDPGLIVLFLRFLSATGVDTGRLQCRLYIHDDADLPDALEFWRGVTGLGPGHFSPPVLKASRPGTIRKNTGAGYRGCLSIRVRRGQELYWQIEGWATAAMAGCLLSSGLDSLPAGQPHVRRPSNVRRDLQDRATELRLAGRSRREIQQILDIRSNATLNDALRGLRPLSWTQHISYEDYRARQAAGVNRYWRAERIRREAHKAEVIERCTQEVGRLSRREAVVAAAVAYWCEGTKSKAWRQLDRVTFVNSDPSLIRFFLAFLEVVGVASNRVICRVLIHESGDAGAAEQFWQNVAGVPASQFRRTTLKRHVAKTIWPAGQTGYRGCLVVSVLGGRDLYLQIEGWASAALGDRDRLMSD